jgi:hypothetical protein
MAVDKAGNTHQRRQTPNPLLERLLDNMPLQRYDSDHPQHMNTISRATICSAYLYGGMNAFRVSMMDGILRK